MDVLTSVVDFVTTRPLLTAVLSTLALVVLFIYRYTVYGMNYTIVINFCYNDITDPLRTAGTRYKFVVASSIGL